MPGRGRVRNKTIRKEPEMTHFVYVFMRLGCVWDELYYSVKSLRKNFRGEMEIFCVGDPPKITGVKHIPIARVPNNSHAKSLDAANKLLKICDSPEINDDFVYMYDDIILLQPSNEEDFRKIYAVDYVDSVGLYFGPNAKPSKKWIAIFHSTFNKLKEEGLKTWNYETHTPRWYNKDKIRQIIDKYDFTNNPALFASLYYNNFEDAPWDRVDNVKTGVYDPHEMKWVERSMNKRFLNYDDNGLNAHLRRWIKRNI